MGGRCCPGAEGHLADAELDEVKGDFRKLESYLGIQQHPHPWRRLPHGWQSRLLLFLDPLLVFHVYEVPFLIGLPGVNPTLYRAESLVVTLGKRAMEELTAAVHRLSYVVLKGPQVPGTPAALWEAVGLVIETEGCFSRR